MGCNLPLWYMQAETQNTFMFRRKLIQIFKIFFLFIKNAFKEDISKREGKTNIL